jgi:hypothetical protein
MDIEVTEEAAQILLRSFELAGIDPSSGGVRLRPARGLGGGVSVQIEFAAAPGDGEEVISTAGIRLFVIPSELTDAVPNPIVAVEPQHDRVVVRPRS